MAQRPLLCRAIEVPTDGPSRFYSEHMICRREREASVVTARKNTGVSFGVEMEVGMEEKLPYFIH